MPVEIRWERSKNILAGAWVGRDVLIRGHACGAWGKRLRSGMAFGGVTGSGMWGEDLPVAAGMGKKKALCGNRRPSNDCLPYEKSSKDRCCCCGLRSSQRAQR